MSLIVEKNAAGPGLDTSAPGAPNTGESRLEVPPNI